MDILQVIVCQFCSLRYWFLFDREFKYKIQIKDTPDFTNGSYDYESPELVSVNGIVKWQTPILQNGEYFWQNSDL
jgi:hypothetical protein